MTFLGISFLIPLMFQEEQSTKDEAPTKESALTGQRPALFPRMALSKLQMHSVAESIKDDNLLRQDAHCSDSEFIKHKRADQVHLCFCFLERCRLRHRHLFFRSCLEKLWAPSRASCNRLCHATYGNTWCQRCGLFLGNWYFYNYPARFRSQPVHLQNGMLVHHFRICTHHLSVWFFRRGLRIFRTFFGNAKLNFIKQLEAAGAASGLPGDHGYSPHTQYFQYQRYTLRPVASGHESRSASGGKKRHHQNLRSESSRYLRIQKYQNNRRKSRQAYRQWKRSASSPANLTLAQYCPPPPRKGCKLVFTNVTVLPVLETHQHAPRVRFSLRNMSTETGSPYLPFAFDLWPLLAASSFSTAGMSKLSWVLASTKCLRTSSTQSNAELSACKKLKALQPITFAR